MAEYIKVTGAILERGGKILIAQRKAGSDLGGKWEFPGGKVETGETPEECLKRELKEELGIDVRVGAHAGTSIHHYDHQSIELLVYFVFWESGDIEVRAHDRIEWVAIRRLIEYSFAPADEPFVERLISGRIGIPLCVAQKGR